MNPDDSPSRSPRQGTPADAPWLLRHKVELPDPVAGYVNRPTLQKRCSAMANRITLLQAPGGFGKTALLARCCHLLRAKGVAVAWLSLDEDDRPEALAGYLSLAFKSAGLDTTAPQTRDEDAGDDLAPAQDADTRAGYRINLLIGAIERLRTPCLLALDEIERLRNAEAVAMLNRLVRAAPPNLHLAMACRALPAGLDISMLLLDGRVNAIKTDDLRFSRADVAKFFDKKLSRREITELAAKSAGWPIALRIYRNASRSDALPDIVGEADVAAAWIESRLWRGMSGADRDFVLDIALFDWIDPDLIDEATGTLSSRRRLASMGALAGLLQTSGGANSPMRMHPLIRDHCANRRFVEDPVRFRSIHRVIAKALARRGQVVDAMRHAAEAADSALVGEIAVGAGGIQLWIRRGFGALRTVDGYLTEEVLAAHPRLALVRCLVLAISGNLEEANRVCDAVSDVLPKPQPGLRAGGTSASLIDQVLVRGILGLISCSPVTDHTKWMSSSAALQQEPDTDAVARGMFKLGTCIALNAKTRFNDALEWADRARTDLGRTTLYLSPHVDYQAGLACMALGLTREAERWYGRGLDAARTRRLGDTSTVLFGEILTAELALERSAGPPRHRPPPASPSVLGECGAWLDIYAAGTSVATEFALSENGLDSALEAVDNAREYAGRTARFTLVKLLWAMRVTLLATGGRTNEAERAWRVGDLPAKATDCLDLEQLSWREVEALAGARLDLLVARRDVEGARKFAAALLDIARRRQMVRTLMRTLAAAVRLESQAGDTRRAMAHLGSFLELYAMADYARPLAREQEAAVPLLNRAAREADRQSAITAVQLRDAIVDARVEPPRAPAADAVLTQQERDILVRIAHDTDAKIARDLGLTYDAVRYRIRQVFAKLNARSKHDAVHKARSLGILSPDESD